MSDSFATLWTIAHQAPLSMGFPRQEYWNGLPFPSPRDLPNPGIKPVYIYIHTRGRVDYKMEINKLVVVGTYGEMCVFEVYLQDGESVYNKTVHS